MSFSEKIKENHQVLKKCEAVSAFNVGASRAYYCAFINIKRYLIAKDYDYNQFLAHIDKTEEREYSHGTIKRALFECLLKNKNNIKNISQLNVIDNLYRKRKIADYDEKEISNTQFYDSLKELEIIETILGAVQ